MNRNTVRWATRRARDAAGLSPRLQVDEVAVARALAGDRPTVMNLGERREAVARLRAQGASVAVTARLLKLSIRTVERYRRAAA